MPIDPRKKTARFNFGLNGLVTKENPTLLSDGQYRSMSNMEVVQEGSLSTRAGKKFIGVIGTAAAATECYMIRKMVVTPGEDPAVPATNPRYLGIYESGVFDLIRTVNYQTGSGTVVGTGINSSIDAARRQAFSLAAYAAGEVGGPWAFIASEKKMLKDSGNSPFGTLPMWGVPPANGVATAAIVVGSPATISNITYDFGSYTGVIITLSAPVSMSDFDQIVIAGVTGVAITTTDGTTDINSGGGAGQLPSWSIRIGVPAADGTIDPTTTDTMFRIYDSNGQSVLGSGAFAGGTAKLFGTAGFPSAGNLDGGSESSPNNSQPYDYRFVDIDSNSNNKGNPSQTMLTASQVTNGVPVSVHLGKITVTVWGTGLSNLGTIAIYRRGGILSDAWRFITNVPNPGLSAGVPVAGTYVDNAADADIQFNAVLETDNDPPVPSTVTTSTGAKGTLTGPTGVGRQAVTLASGSLSLVTQGTVLHVSSVTPEDVIVESVVGSTLTAYFQFNQPNGAAVQADTICGQPGYLAITYQQFVIVAGDKNNPHLLYRSKGDAPEAFSITPADGSVATVACGSPSNPVLNMYEYRGQIATLNLYGIFETGLLNGSFYPAQRMDGKGTVGRRANCKTDTEIWFLSTDGVYSWDGSTCRKRSEAIDPIFHGQEINGFFPLDYSQAQYCVMEYRRGQVYLIYQDTANERREIIFEPAFGDRARPPDISVPPITFLYAEPDTQSIVEAQIGLGGGSPLGVQFALLDQYRISGVVNYTADYFDNGGTWAPPSPTNGGAVIPFSLTLPWFDMGNPISKKLYEEILLEADTSNLAVGPTATLLVEVLVDFSDVAVDAFTVTVPGSATARSIISMLPNILPASGKLQAYGREAKAISYRISGQAFPAQVQFFSITLAYQDTEALTSGGAGDWTNLGYPHDKRLYQMVVEYDTEGNDQTIVLDMMTGVDGNTYVAANQSFVLSNPVIAGAGRGRKTFPLTDGTIAKMVRVRALSTSADAFSASTSFFKIFSVEFPEIENYPPDIVSYTPREDGGYPYAKYINQATVEVDTNGKAIAVQVQADGNVVANLTITAIEGDRERNLTLPPGLSGKQWRLYVDPLQDAIVNHGGKFQLFNPGKIFRFQPADKGEVGHTFDWDELGHPWDKYLKSVTIEWDNTGGPDVTLQLDTLTGINGQTVNPAIDTFVLSGGRSKREFPIPKDTIAKMIRLYPTAAPPVTFKQWKYQFDQINYPSDIILSTEWRNAESPTDKNPSWLSIDADTAGIACAVTLENEAGAVMTVAHTGTTTGRMANYAIPVDTFGKMWRLSTAPGAGGKFQLFAWGFARWQPTAQSSPADPPEVVTWTPWRDAESPDDKNPSWLAIEAFTAGQAVPVDLVNEAGVVMTVNHVGTHTNRMANYPISADVFAKMWRLLAAPAGGGRFQLWNWGFRRWEPTPQNSGIDPPDVVLWTPWNDFGWPYGSIGRNLILKIDTGGVACSIALQTEAGGTVQTFPVTTTYATRSVVLPCNAGLGGLAWRLLLTPGNGGKAKLWDWSVEIIKEPASVNQWTSTPIDFGYRGFKALRQGWLSYKCASTITFTVVSGTGSYSVTLPAHAVRDAERFPFPAVWGAGLNKSKLYTVSWASASPARVYPDMSGLEWLPLGADERAGCQQLSLSEMMAPAV